MIKVLKKMRDQYVINHANRIKIPVFKPSKIERKRIIFSGRVQKVGFRLELSCLAKRLKLTGMVRNLEDGSVEAEIQGEREKIDFLIQCMKSLKRAKVIKVIIHEMEVHSDEMDFHIIR